MIVLARMTVGLPLHARPPPCRPHRPWPDRGRRGAAAPVARRNSPSTSSSNSGYLPKKCSRMYEPGSTVYFWYWPSTTSAIRFISRPWSRLRQQRVPIAAPDHLDHVPAGAAEHGLQLLDDLAVAADRAVQPLQVAVDHEDQVVEFLAGRQRDRAERLRLVAFAVAQERPDLLSASVLDAAVVQILVEPGLVDGHDRRQTHRHRGKLPEVGHQPGVGIRRQPASGLQFAAEIDQLLLA